MGVQVHAWGIGVLMQKHGYWPVGHDDLEQMAARQPADGRQNHAIPTALMTRKV